MNFREILKVTTFADRILFSAVILLSLLCLIFIRSLIPQDTSVEITVDGKLQYVLTLNEEKLIRVEGVQGTTLVEIRDRMVRVIESPCSNKICVQQGWVAHGIIACLPNKVIITIGNTGKEGSAPDAVTE